MSVRLLACLLALGFVLTASAQAQEVTTYSYDALDRLTKAQTSGGSNNGVVSSIGFDAAGNRSNYTVTTASAPSNCILTAADDLAGTDEFSVYPYLVRSGTCAGPVGVAYSVQYVRGQGYYETAWSLGSGPFDPNDNSAYGTHRYVRITPYSGVPAGNPLVLKIVWTITSGSATLQRNSTIVTIYNADCYC